MDTMPQHAIFVLPPFLRAGWGTRMRILQLFGCVRGKHRRSRRGAWHDGVTYRSRCVGCGKPMIRRAGGWLVDQHPIDRPESA